MPVKVRECKNQALRNPLKFSVIVPALRNTFKTIQTLPLSPQSTTPFLKAFNNLENELKFKRKASI